MLRVDWVISEPLPSCTEFSFHVIVRLLFQCQCVWSVPFFLVMGLLGCQCVYFSNKKPLRTSVSREGTEPLPSFTWFPIDVLPSSIHENDTIFRVALDCVESSQTAVSE